MLTPEKAPPGPSTCQRFHRETMTHQWSQDGSTDPTDRHVRKKNGGGPREHPDGNPQLNLIYNTELNMGSTKASGMPTSPTSLKFQASQNTSPLHQELLHLASHAGSRPVPHQHEHPATHPASVAPLTTEAALRPPHLSPTSLKKPRTKSTREDGARALLLPPTPTPHRIPLSTFRTQNPPHVPPHGL